MVWIRPSSSRARFHHLKPLTSSQAREAVRLRNRDSAIDRRSFRNAIRRLPPDFDPDLVAGPALRILDRGWEHLWYFAHDCRHLPASVIRVLLRRLERLSLEPAHVVLRSAIDPTLSDVALERHWQEALKALHDLSTQYPWRSRTLRKKLLGVAAVPWLVGALQAAAVASENPPIQLLAVLAIDGSDSSIDALLPHFGAETNLERLQSLAVHATSPAVNALLKGVGNRLRQRHERSDATKELGRLIKLGPVQHLRIEFSGYGRSRGAKAGTHLLEWVVNSREPEWWRVTLHHFSKDRPTSFGALGLIEDGLGVGICEFPELPQWLEKQRRRMRFEWLPPSPQPCLNFRCSIRGNARAELLRWLLGPVPEGLVGYGHLVWRAGA